MADGVPETVIVFEENVAVTPAGKPVGLPIPEAPTVVNVISGEMAVLTHKVGLVEAFPTVFIGFTVIVPIALIAPHPPVSGRV